MQGINCIKGEIHNVLTVLRLGSQSAASLYSGSEMLQMEVEEQQLIRGLKELYEHICMQTDLAHVDTLSYLAPFLTVITSKHTDIFTTAIALQSIHKFLVYGLIHAESPNVAAAVTLIADSVTHCTFDVTDGEDAEVVSMKILEILLECLRCSAGEYLTDQAVLDMITECFHVRSQQHSSKLLRRYAENVLTQMVLVLFARISPESSNASDLYQSRATSPSPSPLPLPLLRGASAGGPSSGAASSASAATRHRSLSVHSTIKDWNTSTEVSVQKFNATSTPANSLQPTAASTAAATAHIPYGIPALHRVFRFLTNLINPVDVRNSEQDRILGLRLIRTVLETSSTRLGTFPPLIQVVQDELCKYLLQNSQSKNLFVLSLTLRIVFDLFITVKAHLKVQLEVFFTSIHLRIGESASSTYPQKELVLESLVEFCKEVSLIVGLYRNYDVELGCTDLFQDLCRFLANTAMQPWSNGGGNNAAGVKTTSGTLVAASPNQLNILALEGMVAVLNAITKRFCSNYNTHAQTYALAAAAATAAEQTTSRPPQVPATTPLSLISASSSYTSGGGGGGEESDDESTLLILTPEEEAHLLNKRANKQRMTLAASHFNREGLTPKCIKHLQTIKILPPSVINAEAEEEAGANTTTANGTAASPTAAATAAATAAPTATPPTTNGDVASRTSSTRPPAKSRHDPGIPPVSIVHFFRNTPGLDKVKIGEYLGDADPFNIRVLDAFVETFDFALVPKTLQTSGADDAQTEGNGEATTGTVVPSTSSASPSDETSLDDALRSFLDGFKLPGESQQIARIIERFSNAYFAHCPGPLRSADAAYVLCYSVIMLNTDAHNPQVTRKMTKEMYCRNLRGINDNADLPRAYLENLYDSIVNNEIKINNDNLKDIATNGATHDAASWNRVLSNRSRSGGANGGSFQTSAPRIHGREMFLLIWQQSVTIFIHYLENQCASRDGWMLPMQVPTDATLAPKDTDGSRASSPMPSPLRPSSLPLDHLKLLPKIVQGFSLFARICAVYQLNDILNSLLIAICKCLIGFFEELCTECNWESKEMRIAFARDIRLTNLLQLLFHLLHEYGESHVHEGWSNCVHVMLWLRQMDLLPPNWLEMEDFRDSAGRPLESMRLTSRNPHTPNPHRARQERQQSAKADQGKGFWSFWRSAAEEDAPVTSETDSSSTSEFNAAELHWLAHGESIIAECRIPQLFEDSRYFRPSSLSHLVRSLILLSSAGTKRLPSLAAAAYAPAIMHEESAVFCLERLADVIEKNQSRLNLTHAIQEQHLATNANGATTTTANHLPSSPANTVATTTTGTTTNSTMHLWSTIAQHFEHAIANVRQDPSCTFYIERLVVNLLRFSVRLVYSRETTTQLIHLLALLLQLSPATFTQLAQRIVAGTSLFLQTHGESIGTAEEWQVVLRLLLQFKHHPLTAHAAFQTFTYAVENHCNMETFVPLMHALTAYAQTSGEQDAWLPVAPEAVLALLLRLHSKLPSIAMPESTSHSASSSDSVTAAHALLSPAAAARRHIEFDRARTDLWLASLQNFCNIIKNDQRADVRKAALEALNNSLLAVGVSPPISPLGWKICFEQLLIPLLEGVQRYTPESSTASSKQPIADNKLTPTRASSSRVDDPTLPPYDLRLRAATLVFQTFLHHLSVLCENRDFHIFWLKFVGSMERHMQHSVDSGRGALTLHFSESLKNLLLVMNADGVFAAVSERTGQNLLALTWAVIDSFRPDMRQQLQEHMTPVTTTGSRARTRPTTPAQGQTQVSPPRAQVTPAAQGGTPVVKSPSASTTSTRSTSPTQAQAYVEISPSSVAPAAAALTPQAQSAPVPSFTGTVDFSRLAPLHMVDGPPRAASAAAVATIPPHHSQTHAQAAALYSPVTPFQPIPSTAQPPQLLQQHSASHPHVHQQQPYLDPSANRVSSYPPMHMPTPLHSMQPPSQQQQQHQHQLYPAPPSAVPVWMQPPPLAHANSPHLHHPTAAYPPPPQHSMPGTSVPPMTNVSLMRPVASGWMAPPPPFPPMHMPAPVMRAPSTTAAPVMHATRPQQQFAPPFVTSAPPPIMGMHNTPPHAAATARTNGTIASHPPSPTVPHAAHAHTNGR